MCARYVLGLPLPLLLSLFEISPDPLAPEFTPRYNIAPTQVVPVMRRDESGKRALDFMRWGLIPPWATDASIGSKMVNARSETVAEKPSFREPYRKRRCLVPASGYYEWRTEGKIKQPYLVSDPTDQILTFAGIWENSKVNGQEVKTFSILTQSAIPELVELHDRMPVLVAPTFRDGWLAGTQGISPYPGRLEVRKVSTKVNSVRNDSPELLSPC
jgi:putative SOS response-associated peptidase YedK